MLSKYENIIKENGLQEASLSEWKDGLITIYYEKNMAVINSEKDLIEFCRKYKNYVAPKPIPLTPFQEQAERVTINTWRSGK